MVVRMIANPEPEAGIFILHGKHRIMCFNPSGPKPANVLDGTDGCLDTVFSRDSKPPACSGRLSIPIYVLNVFYGEPC